MKSRVLSSLLVGTVLASVLMGCGNTTAETMVSENTAEVEGTEVVDPIEEEYTITPPVLEAIKEYAPILSSLSAGQAYAYAYVGGNYDVLLVADNDVYDYDGVFGATAATIYGLDEERHVMEIGYVNTGDTAYPLAIYEDSYLIYANNQSVFMQYLDENSNMMITQKTAQVYYEEDVPYYFYSDLVAGFDGLYEDDSKLIEMYDQYGQSYIIPFVIVE